MTILTDTDTHTPPAIPTAPDGGNDDFQSITFDGNTREYFGIWISNIVLSIITLGIYSAWAKVRRIRYFYNHTKIKDFSLGYHATGKEILKGRILTVLLLVAANGITTIFPTADLLLLIPVFFLIPWAINSSLRFHLRRTSWRNVRFNWHGTYWKTMYYYFILPIISVASFGLLAPVISRYTYQYYVSHNSFGTTRFNANLAIKPFYGAFFTSCLPVAVSFIFVLFLFAYPFKGLFDDIVNRNIEQHSNVEFGIILSILLIYITSYSAISIYQAICRNIVLRSTTLGDIAAFGSVLSALKLVWIQISNVIAILCSLGLLLPWAAVRRYSYLSSVSLYKFIGDEGAFVDTENQKTSAFGEEFADMESLDIGLN